jgi:multidrug efflux system membrane fusion protein
MPYSQGPLEIGAVRQHLHFTWAEDMANPARDRRWTDPERPGLIALGRKASVLSQLAVLAAFIVLIVAAVLAAKWLAAGTEAGPAPGGKAASPVVIATAATKPVPYDVTTIGRIQPIASVAVRSRIDGVITSVAVQEGQHVKAGDLLFTLDDRELRAEVHSAEAAMKSSQAQLDNAKREVERVAPLVKKDIASRQQVDQLNTNLAAAQAALLGAQAQLETRQVQLSYAEIRAPIDGRIGSIALKTGNSVRANDAQPLVTIDQLKPIYATFSIPQSYLSQVQDAMHAGPVKVTASIPGVKDTPPYDGVLNFIDNAIDPATNTVPLKATFSNDQERLWPGQFINVVITLRVDPNALVVPTEAVQSGQSGSFVFVVKPDSTVEMRPVVISQANAEQTVIARGLAAGERVVTQGQLRLEPGSRVEIRQGSGGTAPKEPAS